MRVNGLTMEDRAAPRGWKGPARDSINETKQRTATGRSGFIFLREVPGLKYLDGSPTN